MNKLTGTTIGVSAMGMFVVDPAALVTVIETFYYLLLFMLFLYIMYYLFTSYQMFGIMITYFIILLQFRIGYEDFNCKCPLP